MTISSAPNRHLICGRCGKDLGTIHDRRLGRPVPDAFQTVDGRILCFDCFVQELEEQSARKRSRRAVAKG